MHRVGLVTYRGLPELSRDDQLLLAPLAQRGIRAEAVAWDDPAVAWASYDALVIRSTWNYHTALGEFTAWIDRIESLGIALWNPAKIVRWNADKAYLQDLHAQRVDVVPTRWIARGVATTLGETLRDAGWSEGVIKPAVSASAYETFRVSAADVTREDESRFHRLTAAGIVMVQPFLRELARDGEWSVMFIGGTYSHAVLKRARPGDFRVQHEHGGTAEPRTPPPSVVSTASAILDRVDGPLLYARVDGVEIDRRLVLVELELLEPSLFLGADAAAPERLAEAICEVTR